LPVSVDPIVKSFMALASLHRTPVARINQKSAMNG